MAHSKAGNNKNGPSHVRYKNENRRHTNKLRRVKKFNGSVFAEMWESIYGRR